MSTLARVTAIVPTQVRGQIRLLRKEFETLLAENSSLPEPLRLGRDELEIDPEIARQIARREEARRAQ